MARESMKLDEAARGVFTIAVTPFRPDGALDTHSLPRMVDFYLEKGATGLTILGMMGEAGKLTPEESRIVIQSVTARTSVPVVVGVSAPGLAAMGDLAKAAMESGAAGVMVAPTGGLRTDAQIYGYFLNVAETLGEIPFVLQDFPLVTGVQIDPAVILQIVADCPTCVMLKHEDWPGLEKISALRAASEAGARRISVLCGNGGLFLPEEMGRGADGAMTGFAYPEMMAGVVEAMEAGDPDAAQTLFDIYLPLVRYENQPGLGLAIRKATLAERGAIAHPTLRRPGPSLSAAAEAERRRLIARLEAALAQF
ncbi:MAG: dihydrodipicolinate synthase family protein [Pseudomonadota bacterium]